LPADPYEALANPTRREILLLLRENAELSAGQLAAAFPTVSRPAVSRHLAVLRRARLVHSRAHGREHHYSLDPAPIAEVYRTFLAAFLPVAERSLENLKQIVESDESR
jgi:DNA-binding transcriptional ArsR family regulator